MHNLTGALHYLPALYFDDSAGSLEQFSFERFVRRHTHLPEFQSQFRRFIATYQEAYEQGRVRNDAAPTELLERFGRSAR